MLYPAGVLSYLSSRAGSSSDAAFLTSARRSDKLLVPTAGALLMPASRVVHMGGAGGSMTAARLLGRTDPQQLVLAHPQLPEHVCRWVAGMQPSSWFECLSACYTRERHLAGHILHLSV
jgi:hypothetical protein